MWDRSFSCARRKPPLPSAPDTKSFSSVSSPILACRLFTSTPGPSSALTGAPKMPVAASRSWSRHCLIWFGRTSNSCANSISVFSPLIPDTAAIALNAGLWFRRGHLAMVFSSRAASCCGCTESPLNQPLQFSRTSSNRPRASIWKYIACLKSSDNGHPNVLLFAYGNI